MKDKVFVFYSDNLNFKSEESKDGKKFYVEGYISTGDLDLVNDIVTESGLKDMANQLTERNIKIDFEHEAFRGNSEIESQINKTILPLGRIIESTKDEKGIKIKAELNSNWNKLDKEGNITRTFNDVWSSIKSKFLDAFSIAYIPLKTAVKQKGEDTIRLLDGVNLLNVALTGNPVNPYASMTAVMAKSLNYIKEAEKKTKGDNMSKEKPKETPEAKPEGEKPAEPKEPVKPAEAKPAEPAKPEGEKKSDDLIEVKSRLEKLENENKELKAVIEKAQHKSIGAEPKSDKIAEVKSLGPVDYI